MGYLPEIHMLEGSRVVLCKCLILKHLYFSEIRAAC